MLNRESTMHDGGIPGTIKQRSACQLQRMTSIGKSNMGPLQVKASSIDRYKQMIYDNLTDMTPICAVARKRSKSFRLQNLLKNNWYEWLLSWMDFVERYGHRNNICSFGVLWKSYCFWRHYDFAFDLESYLTFLVSMSKSICILAKRMVQISRTMRQLTRLTNFDIKWMIKICSEYSNGVT